MHYFGPMKALTILQPWATFVAIRAKRYETRGWLTKYRGPLAIHAGARPVSLDDLRLPGIAEALRRHCVVPPNIPLHLFPEYLPLGQVLCVADLIACHRSEIMTAAGEIQMTEEFDLGNYEPGRFAFELELQEVFKPGLPARGAQGLWTYLFTDSLTPKEANVPKDKKPAAEKTAKPAVMDEAQIKDEKDAVGQAFAQSTERPGVPTDPAFDPDSKPAEAPVSAVKMPEVPVYTYPVTADEFLAPFPKMVFLRFTVEERATKADEMAACDEERKIMEIEMSEVVKEWKDKLKANESRRIAISAQVTARGIEREIQALKRINEEKQEAVIFNAKTLEVVETYPLTDKDLQTELRVIETNRAAAETKTKPPKGANVVKGNFPADKMVGASAVENPELDAKNEAALKALAGAKE